MACEVLQNTKYQNCEILTQHGVKRSSEESGEKIGPEQDVEEDLQSKKYIFHKQTNKQRNRQRGLAKQNLKVDKQKKLKTNKDDLQSKIT